MRKFDVVVVGGGAVGAATLFELSRRGKRSALLVEKKVGFGRGSTGSWGSLIRVWHLNPQTTQWACESVPHYLNFQEITGRSAQYVRTGSLYFMNRNRWEKMSGHFEKAQSKLPLVFLNADEGKKRFPDFQWMEEDVAVYEEYAGFTCPWSTTSGWIAAAKDRGLESEVETELVDIKTEGDRVTGVVLSTGEEIQCGEVILATGAWTPKIVDKIGESVPIAPKMIQVNQFKRTGSNRAIPFFIDLENKTFGRPAPDGSFLGGFVPEEFQCPSKFVQPLSLEVAHEAKRRLSTRINWIKNATLTGGIRAVEGYTSDLNGICRPSERFQNLIVSAGWSCCGFTLAPAIAARTARLVGAQ